MGVDRYLYHGNKCVANLGRTYHYEVPDIDDIRLKVKLYAIREPEEWCDLLETIVEFHERKARSDLINTILEDGALVVRDE